MQISMTLLEKWVHLGPNPMELRDDLTLAGLEVSSTTVLEKIDQRIVVGEIIECRAHPLRDKLQICRVIIGSGQPLQIICGARNVRKGVKVATALPGATLPNGNTVESKNIGHSTSGGVLCSSIELKLDEASDGIMELDDSAQIGCSVTEHFELDDTIIDVELTPNRGDCLSILGIAREVAAIRGTSLKERSSRSIKSAISTRIPLAVEASDDAPRYLGRVIENLNPMSVTPDWMREGLRRCGLRSLGPVVDITNFVMLELGQPLHAFDLRAVEEGIVVRHARVGEALTLLDGTEIKLLPETLVIADKIHPIGLAGIMGGKHSGVSKMTESIFIESAYFRPEIIGRRAREYGLQTDASYRFERGVDPSQQRRAVTRASELLIEICGGQLGPICEIVDPSSLPKKRSIVLRRERLDQILGIKVPVRTIKRILTGLNMIVEEHAKGWRVRPPRYRFDLKGEHDLTEEIARLFGLENIPNKMPRIIAKQALSSEKKMVLDHFENYLISRDYSEVITYSFVDDLLQARLEPEGLSVKLLNPIASNMNVMRLSLWPGLLRSVGVNYRRQVRRIRLFETGHVFCRTNGSIDEVSKIGGAACGPINKVHWGDQPRAIDFFDMKGEVEGLLELDGRKRLYQYVPTDHPGLHPGQSAEIRYESRLIGFVGLLHPVIQQFLDFPFSVYIFEIDLAEISERYIPSYKSSSRFPSVNRDLSIVIKEEISAIKVEELITSTAGLLLTSIALFDIYVGKEIKKYYKSLSFSLTLQSSSRNLTDKEVEAVLDRIVTTLKTIGGELRSSFEHKS